jgi:hypothetical protein
MSDIDKVAKRNKVIAEIIETERIYSENISKLASEYIAPLKLHANDFNIKPEKISALFSNLETLSGFHNILYSEFAASTTTAAIAKTILKFADFLRLYTIYVNNYSNAMKALTDLQQHSKKFVAFQQERRSVFGMDLASYLIMPVQRIPRYELLLKELKRNLDANNEEDAALLDEALAKVVAVAQHVNEMKREAERASELLQVQGKIIGLDQHLKSLFVAHRRLMKEGEVHKHTTFSKAARYLFLLNDLFIWTEKHKYKGHINTSTAQIKEINDENGDFGFELQHPQSKTQTFYCDTQSERNLWLSAWQEAIEEARNIEINNLNTELHHGGARRGSAQFAIEPKSPTSISRSRGNSMSDYHNEPVKLHNDESEENEEHKQPVIAEETETKQEEEEEHKEQPAFSVHNDPSHQRKASSSTNSNLSVPQQNGAHRKNSSVSSVKSAGPGHSRNSSAQMKAEEKLAAPAALSVPSVPNIAVSVAKLGHSRNASSTSNQSLGVESVITPARRASASHSRKSSAVLTPNIISSPNPANSTNNSTIPSNSSTIPSNSSTIPAKPATLAPKTEHKSALPVRKTSISTSAAAEAASKLFADFDSNLNAAASALEKMSRNDMLALKKMKNPPIPVKLAIESVAVLMDLEPALPQRGSKQLDYWMPVQSLLVKPTFLRILLDFNEQKPVLSNETMNRLGKYINDPQLLPSLVKICSSSAGTLWEWVRAYYAKATNTILPADDFAKNTSGTKPAPVKSKVAAMINSKAPSKAPSKQPSRVASRAGSRRGSVTGEIADKLAAAATGSQTARLAHGRTKSHSVALDNNHHMGASSGALTSRLVKPTSTSSVISTPAKPNLNRIASTSKLPSSMTPTTIRKPGVTTTVANLSNRTATTNTTSSKTQGTAARPISAAAKTKTLATSQSTASIPSSKPAAKLKLGVHQG